MSSPSSVCALTAARHTVLPLTRMGVLGVTLLQLPCHLRATPPPTHTRVGDGMGRAEAVREVPRQGMANTPNPPLKAAQPVEGSLPAPRVPGGEGSGVTVCDLESESSPTEAVRMEEPSGRS